MFSLAQEALDEAIRGLEDDETSTCEEKTNAALAFAAIARVTGVHFGKYVDATISLLHAGAVALHPSIRSACFKALGPCVTASITTWSKPLRSSAQSTSLHAISEGHADAALVTCLLGLEDDDDADTVASACDCLASIAQDAGWPFVRHYLKRLSKRLGRLMTERALCNKKRQMSWQTSQRLYGALAHLLCALSSVWAQDVVSSMPPHVLLADLRGGGRMLEEAADDEVPQHDDQADGKGGWEARLAAALADWQSLFDVVYPSVLDWAGPHEPDWLRRLAFGLVATVARQAPWRLHDDGASELDRYAYPLFPLLNMSLAQAADANILGTAGDDVEAEHTPELRNTLWTAKQQMLQNAAFCVGVLGAQGTGGVAMEALKVEPLLMALLDKTCVVDDAVRDNAVGALGCSCALVAAED